MYQIDDQDILHSLIRIKEKLPKKQKQLCNYIIEHINTVGMMTITELAENAKVGTSTVLRVMKELGFDHYTDFKKAFHKVTLQSKPTWWHLQKSLSNHEITGNQTLTDVWNEVTNLLNKTLTEQLAHNFQKAVEMMINASQINILGMRSSKALAIYFGNLLEEFYPKVKQLSLEQDFIYDRVIRFKENEILFLISNSPYSSQSVEIAKFCHSRKVPIILLTDHLSSPIASYSTVVLKTEASQKQYSVVPTITLLEALVIEIGRRNSQSAISNLSELGKILQEMDITRS